ncbi:recombinase RecT [Bosea sp. 2YAB26]|uniref:recombinase RecT n=1 Tax=Bosea sp. 2YAB26 TaxID=3237478 RepID=UPI003F904CF1
MAQDVQTIEQRIEERINKDTTGTLTVSDRAGGLVFTKVAEVMEFAKLLAISGVAVPKHLRGNPGACLGVVMQSIEWRMSPYAVANKSYSVNDRLAYEAQLLHAVVLSRGPIKGRPAVKYTGIGDKRQCEISVELNDGTAQIVDYLSPEFGKITPKNSPLWKADPDQQLFYFSARALARRHFPDVILGVYAKDEFDDGAVPDAQTREVAPRHRTLASKLDALAGTRSEPAHDAETGEIIEAETDDTTDTRLDAVADEAATDHEIAADAADNDRFLGDPDPVADARQRGREAKEAGLGTRAMPGEYRAEGREAEAEAWLDGHKSVAMAEG